MYTRTPACAGRRERGGEDRLLDHERGAAVATHPVHHAEERGDRDDGGRARDRKQRAEQRAEEVDREEHAAAAEAISGERHREERERRAGEPRTRGETDLRRRERQLGEVDREEDSDEAVRERADECRRVDEPGVARHVANESEWPRHHKLKF